MNKAITVSTTLIVILALISALAIQVNTSAQAKAAAQANTAAVKGYKFASTAYGPPWGAIEGGDNASCSPTASGVQLCQGEQKLVVAVDPKVVPLGTKMKIWPNPFNRPGLVFTAADTGGAIQGRRVDIFIASGSKAINRWGKRNVTVTPVGKGSPQDVAICTKCSK